MRNSHFPKLILFIVLIFSFFTPSAFAQNTFKITGHVTDSATNKGAEYATVIILDKEGKSAASLITEASGRFGATVKEAGEYTLTVSSIGYRTLEKPIRIEAPETDLGELVLVPGVEMESVTVSTTKPLIRSDIDKIAYSVEADPEAPVSTALDILRKVPLITVDGEDNVLLQGQSNYKVLLNGKSSSMLSNNFKEMMRSMPASSIKDIEVITNPSSRYEAEGVGGIINIVTLRKNDVGYSGSVGLSTNSQGGYGGNGYLSGKVGKFTLSTNLYANRVKQPGYNLTSYQENRIMGQITESEGGADLKADIYQYQVEASYEVDSLNLLTLSFWGYNQDINMDQYMDSWITDTEGNPLWSYRNRIWNSQKSGGLSGNIDYQRTFMKPDRTFTLSYKLENNPNDRTTENIIENTVNYTPYQQRSVNDAVFWEHTFQVDYLDPITAKSTLEVGAKYILRQNESDPETYRRATSADPWVDDPTQWNKLDYDQHILGAYLGYTYKFNPKASVKVGTRAEATWNDGVFSWYNHESQQNDETRFDNRQFNLVPYVTLSYAPKPTNRFSLSYTQRLYRPSISILNPYVNTSNPESIYYGNPDLESEVSHSFNLTYGIFGSSHTLNLQANAMLVNNSIEYYTWFEENESFSRSSYFNIGKRRTFGANAYYSYRLGAKLTFNTSLNARYVDISRSGDGAGNSGWSYNGYVQARVGVWKNGAFTGTVQYSSPSVSLQSESSGMFYYGMSFSQRLLKQKLSLSISVTSPFRKYLTYWSEMDSEHFYRRSDQRQLIRNLSFSVNYTFGKMNVQVKRARRGIQNDDLKGGSGGEGGSTVSAGSAGSQ